MRHYAWRFLGLRDGWARPRIFSNRGQGRSVIVFVGGETQRASEKCTSWAPILLDCETKSLEITLNTSLLAPKLRSRAFPMLDFIHLKHRSLSVETSEIGRGGCDGRRHIRPICSCFSPSSRHIASKTASSAIQSRTQICVGSGSRAPKLRRAELGTCVNTFDQLHPTKIDQQTTAERPQIPTIRLRCRKVEVPSAAELGNEQSGDDAEGKAPPCGGGRTQLGRLVFLRTLKKTPTERLGPSVGACSWVDRRARRGPP